VLGQESVDDDQAERAEDKHGRLAAPGSGHDLKRSAGRVQDAALLLRIRGRRAERLRSKTWDRSSYGRDEVVEGEHGGYERKTYYTSTARNTVEERRRIASSVGAAVSAHGRSERAASSCPSARGLCLGDAPLRDRFDRGCRE
jgi:hypothetical protein